MYENMGSHGKSNSELPEEMKALVEKKIADIDVRIKAEKDRLTVAHEVTGMPITESNSTISKLEDEKAMLLSHCFDTNAKGGASEKSPDVEDKKAA